MARARGLAVRFVATALLSGLSLSALRADPPAVPAAASAAASELFVVRYEPGAAWKPGRPMSEQGLLDHFRYVRSLHARGLIVLAGPAGADGGVIILRARDRAEAAEIMGRDPAVTAGIFVGSLQPFSPVFVGEAPAAVPPR